MTSLEKVEDIIKMILHDIHLKQSKERISGGADGVEGVRAPSVHPISPGLCGGDLPKIPGKCPMGLKLGRVPQRGLNITFKPKKSQPSTYGCHRLS